MGLHEASQISNQILNCSLYCSLSVSCLHVGWTSGLWQTVKRVAVSSLNHLTQPELTV